MRIKHMANYTLSMTNGCTTILIACLSFSLASCSTDDVASSAAVSVLPVAVVGYGSAYVGKAGWQNTSIALDAPDVLFAEEIEYVPAPAFDPAYAKLPALADNYWYMGSKGDFNYLMHYPPFGLRKVLKIKKSNYAISDPFPLTSLSKSWRRLNFSPQFDFVRANGYVMPADPPVDDVFKFDLFPGAGLHRQRNLNREGPLFVDENGTIIMTVGWEALLPAADIHHVFPIEPFPRESRLDDEPAEPSPRKERR